MGQQTEQPPWLENYAAQKGGGAKPDATVADKPKRPRGNPNWQKGGTSPNPSGRPAVIGMARTEVEKLLQNNVGGILELQIAKALEGDSGAATLVLSRVMAPLRPSGEKVQFAFDPSLPIARQVEQVLAAVAAGHVAPDIGQQITTIIGTLSSIRANEELEQRIIQLEAKAVNA